MKRYDGEIAVVTGASSGLGRRLATDLVARGATVVAIARSEDALRELAVDGNGHVIATPCDVNDEAALTAALRSVERDHGRIDILINSAGWEEATPVEDANITLYHRIFATNFFGVVTATLTAVPGMLQRGSGIVVNVSSDHGRAPAPGTPAYSASKAAVSAFTESVAHECHGRGVHLHVLYPGWVPTPLGQAVVEAGMPQPPKVVQRSEQQVSSATLDRMGGAGIEINCARIATLAPVMRALAPALYRSQMRKQANRG